MPDAPLGCPKCGNNEFVVPDPATNDSPVICTSCGATIGPWGEVRVGILDEVKELKGARKGAPQGSGLAARRVSQTRKTCQRDNPCNPRNLFRFLLQSSPSA